MPANVVKTPAEEKKWDKAKELAEKAGKGDNYAYIMGIFKKMNPDRFSVFSCNLTLDLINDFERNKESKMVKNTISKIASNVMEMVIAKDTEYQKYFRKMLQEEGIKSPAELSEDEKKVFFEKVDKGWKSDKEKTSSRRGKRS